MHITGGPASFPMRHPWAELVWLAALVVVLGTACSESSVTPELAPSPLNPEKIGELAILCPPGVQVQSQDGQPVPLPFALPSTRGGESPIAVTCTPASGSAFPIGRSAVSCTASDKLGQSASCSFTAVVLPPPRLAITRIMAYGDSLTEGNVSSPLGGLAIEVNNAYPTKLWNRLRQAYRIQPIQVINEGVSGEKAVDARSRFRLALARHQPELVILMEGTNDLGLPTATGSAALSAMDTMVDMAQDAGAAVVLATIPPIRPVSVYALHASKVGSYNSGIRSLAARAGAPLIDVNAIIRSGNCFGLSSATTLPCIGIDNIHPTAAGYELIAAAMFDYIVATYDLPVSVPSTATARGAADAADGRATAGGMTHAGALAPASREGRGPR